MAVARPLRYILWCEGVLGPAYGRPAVRPAAAHPVAPRAWNIEERSVKKLSLPLLAVSALALAFVGCGKSPGTANTTTPTSSGGGSASGTVTMGPTTFTTASVTAKV